MKKILVSLFLLGILLLPVIVFAQMPPVPGQISSIENLYDKIKTAAWSIFALVALVCFIIAAVLFLSAGGDPDKIKQARLAFMWGVGGVVVAVLAYSIVSIVTGVLR